MTDRRRLLLRSSEHITQLIQLALLHEENIQAEYNYRDASRNNRIRNYEVQTQTFEFDVSELLERFIDPSYNRRTIFDVTTINNWKSKEFSFIEDNVNIKVNIIWLDPLDFSKYNSADFYTAIDILKSVTEDEINPLSFVLATNVCNVNTSLFK